MRISHGTRIAHIKSTNGYGYATDRMAHALKELGHDFNQNDPEAPVQMWFDQPHHWEWNESNQYRIGYHPWESTRLKAGWAKMMNEADEIWTPSPLIADWYAKYAGIKKPIYVYEHGVDPIWKPVDRKVEDKMYFLHCGLEAGRKGGGEVMRAFRLAFRDKDDVALTMKCNMSGINVPSFGRTTVVNDEVPVETLVNMFQAHHVYVYPSWGEGFGLTPLQAMATGMPTITVPKWAPYERFLDPNLNISSKMMQSPWPKTHPGKMLAPRVDDLVDHLRWVYDNYDQAKAFAMGQTENIAKEYDWISLTRDAFDSLQNRLENR